MAWTSVLFCATAWRATESPVATPSSRRRVDGVEIATIERRRRRDAPSTAGLVDEEWFFKTHLVIEAAAAPAVAALNEGADVTSRIVSQDSIQDCHEVLSKIEDCFGHVVRDCLPLMFERHGQTARCATTTFFMRDCGRSSMDWMLSYLKGSFRTSPCRCRGRRAPCLPCCRRWTLFWACPTRIGRCKHY